MSERSTEQTEHECRFEVKGLAKGGSIDPQVIALQCMDCGKAKLTFTSHDLPGEDDGVFYDGW